MAYFVGAVIGGGVSAFAALINGESLADALWDGLDGAVVGALIAAYPQLAIIVSSYDLCAQFLDCLYAGYSVEQTFAVMGLAATAECLLPSTGGDLTDTLVDSTFGTVIDISSEVGKTMISDGNASYVDERSVTGRIVNCLICGGSAEIYSIKQEEQIVTAKWSYENGVLDITDLNNGTVTVDLENATITWRGDISTNAQDREVPFVTDSASLDLLKGE